MNYEMISVTREESMLRITLKNPPLNILTIAMMKEIQNALEAARAMRDVTLLIFDAEGKAFSAGADVKEHTSNIVHEMISTFGILFRALNAIPFPTLAVVRGAALGGGCELATFCDMIVASEKSKFGQPEIGVGVFPPVAAAVFPRLIGRNRAIEWLLSGDTLSAQEAERIGLINKVFPEATFDEDVKSFIARFTRHSACVLSFAKRSVDIGSTAPPMSHIHRAEELYLMDLMRTHDANEGLNAFLEKRTPVWKNG